MLRVGSYEARVRVAEERDHRWIVATAVPQVRGRLTRADGVAWQQIGHGVVRLLLPALSIAVCELDDAEPILLGWRAELQGELVYEYVARDYRRHGVASAMRVFCKQREAA